MITVEARPEHAGAIYPRLRLQDAARLYGITAGRSVAAMESLIARSVITWCGMTEAAEPVTLGGVVDLDGQIGYVWQVAAADLAVHKRAYLIQGGQQMERGLALFPRLETRIAADYPQALRHTRRFGWTVGPLDPTPPVPSHLCVRTR